GHVRLCLARYRALAGGVQADLVERQALLLSRLVGQRAELGICEGLDDTDRPARSLSLGLGVREGQRLLAPTVGRPWGGCDPTSRRRRSSTPRSRREPA